MNELLYHFEIGLPEGFQKPEQRVRINYGRHARKEAFQDRYGRIKLPSFVTLGRFQVIEVGMVGDKVSKILFRGRLDETRDLCIVLIPGVDNQPWFCKTVWVNKNNDKHKTLDTTRYETVS
ncbi:hypothetical protein HWB76_gp065 [Streptomyces phage Blueeyedbeauty]|uniref:Uncharacterized protein n=1 Tax=Streptomyces phage Blueeyedbeauty TaxID=2250336 RepID=A0A345L233_9CAUD|nr:hypothetical protein HWB76_gp065 [Streptomyces phage Blueeyedbeauty]AXH49335.1 hypothetical protein SEA_BLUEEYEDBEAUTY_228 [Streptomyces phage Blueeyedbeauty]